jgi:hypothetical protein
MEYRMLTHPYAMVAGKTWPPDRIVATYVTSKD